MLVRWGKNTDKEKTSAKISESYRKTQSELLQPKNTPLPLTDPGIPPGTSEA